MINIIYTADKVVGSFTESMKLCVDTHFDKLYKFLSKDEPVKITAGKEGTKYHLKAQVVTKANKRIRAEDVGENFYDLVVKVRDSLEKQIKKANRKLTWKERILKIDKPEENEELFEIARRKQFDLESINTAMAINQMEKLGHNFYVFKDMDKKDQITVVYKRFDDTFGLIVLK